MTAPSHHDAHAAAALIVGCGFLGTVLARRLVARDVVVFGTTRSPARARGLAALGVRPLLLDTTQPLTLAALTPALECPSLDVYHLVPPGRADADPSPREVIIGGVTNLVSALKAAHLHRGVMTSSTIVYGDAGNARVDADTVAKPADARGELLLEAERHWLALHPSFHVARLAGLYGPGRVIGAKAIRDNAPLVGNPDNLLNLIHVEDAADLLLAMTTCAAPGRIELGCDNHPPRRVDYYTHLAALLDCPAPTVLDDADAARQLGLNVDRLRRASSKRCDNTPTRRRTGWSPRYPDYRVGLDASPERVV